MAELRGEPQPELFRVALHRFEEAVEWASVMDRQLAELIAIDQGQEAHPAFRKSLTAILKEHPPIERVSLHRVRFANIAQARKQAPESPPVGQDLMEIVRGQRKDLALVTKQLEETITAFRDALPRAEDGHFAALMLSGRAGFADKIQQSVDLVETFARSYSQACMTTIAATMQVYPAGLDWLEKPGEMAAEQSAH